VKVLFSLILSTLFLSEVLGATARPEPDKTGIVLTNVKAGLPEPEPLPSIKIYKYTNKYGVRSFSDRAPRGTKYVVFQYTCYACNLRSTVDWYKTPLQLEAYGDSINLAARKYGVDPALVRAVIHAESAFKEGARSQKGAQGLMQLMPDTARDMGVADIMSPDDNIAGGVRYLALLLEQNSGNTTLATAAYNAGPNAVKRHNGIPPFEETQTYVKRVKILHDRYKKALTTNFSGRSISQAASL
jgi:soluble lytic murein transglycosylase-like protein